ncbi:hypothetical protein [Streptomyces sp. NPDC053541]|uniref:hypothetical protein n=1 Tax=Streptomyces sp. NPDC053541 TaxID=3365709 RepID=UPI0037D31E73
MRVRMRVKISGTRDGAEWPDRGDTIDLPDDEAEQLIRYGGAEPTEPEAAEDTVDEDPDEGGDGPDEGDGGEPDVETATVPDTSEKRPTRSRAKG